MMSNLEPDASRTTTRSVSNEARGKESARTVSNQYADPRNVKLPKRLAYLLRYGAVKEGLTVSDRGFVKLSDVLTVPLLSCYSEEALLREVEVATCRGSKRYEMKKVDGEAYIRSLFTRRFERFPYHEGTKVFRLLELCLQKVCTNITDYSLDGVVDEYLIGDIVRRLKRAKRLSNAALASVLSPGLEWLDLSDAYLTPGSLKMIATASPNLRVLSLKYCGFLVNDELLKRLMKNLPLLVDLNVCQCRHLTGLSLRNVARYLPAIGALNVAQIRGFAEADVVALLKACPDLRRLDLTECGLPGTDDFSTELAHFCLARPHLRVYGK